MANNEPKVLDYQAKEVEKVYEGKSQEAIVNQSPKDTFTNTITVDEVKDIVKKGNDEQHIEEILAELEKKADKIGELPHFTVKINDNVLNFITDNKVADKLIVIKTENGYDYIGYFLNYGSPKYSFLFMRGATLYSAQISLSGKKFSDIFGSTYRSQLVKDTDVSLIWDFPEGTILNYGRLSQMKSGDTVKVGTNYFVIAIDTSSSPTKVVGNCISSISSTSMTVAILSWEQNEELALSSITYDMTQHVAE